MLRFVCFSFKKLSSQWIWEITNNLIFRYKTTFRDLRSSDLYRFIAHFYLRSHNSRVRIDIQRGSEDVLCGMVSGHLSQTTKSNFFSAKSRRAWWQEVPKSVLFTSSLRNSCAKSDLEIVFQILHYVCYFTWKCCRVDLTVHEGSKRELNFQSQLDPSLSCDLEYVIVSLICQMEVNFAGCWIKHRRY